MQFDFESVYDRMETDLRSKSSWANILFYSANRRILEVVAESISQMMSYDEFLTRNTKWDLASEKSSLVTQSQFMQYDPMRKVGATGDIRFSSSITFDAAYGKLVDIPKYTVTSDGGDIKFATVESSVLDPLSNYVDIPVVQGEPKTFTYVALGQDYEEIILNNPDIENNYYEVLVNDIVWTEIDDLNNASRTQTSYELRNKFNFDGIEITFGNGIFGKKLNTGDVVKFRYIETLGISGNVTSTGVIDVIEGTQYDIDGAPVSLYCTNPDKLDGGKDEEDIEDIRTNGTLAFQSSDSAVVQRGYEYILEQQSYILKSVVWGAYEKNIDNNLDPWTWIELDENVVTVSAFTPAGEQLTTAQKTSVIESIKDDKPPTDIVQFVDTEFINLVWHIDIKVIDESYVLSEVKTDVINGITNRYSLQNLEFFQALFETEWKGYINGISGVCHHSSYIEIAVFPTWESAYQFDFNLNIYPIDKGTVKVYLNGNEFSDWTLIATDDNTGGFTAEAGYDVVDSSINYETGVGAFFVNSGISGTYTEYDIKILYQHDGFNLCPTTRNQIFKVYEIDDVIAQYSDGCSG